MLVTMLVTMLGLLTYSCCTSAICVPRYLILSEAQNLVSLSNYNFFSLIVEIECLSTVPAPQMCICVQQGHRVL